MSKSTISTFELFQMFPDAEARYEAEAKRLVTTPNWEAQERYDAANGTINGYAPWQYNQER